MTLIMCWKGDSCPRSNLRLLCCQFVVVLVIRLLLMMMERSRCKFEVLIVLSVFWLSHIISFKL